MSTRTPAAALAPGLLLALALWAGEAAAQNVCRDGAHTGGGTITCTEGAGSSADILVNPGSLGINDATANRVAVEGSHSGSGDIELRMTAGSIVTTGTAGHGLYARHAGATGGGAVVVRMSGGSVETRGSNAYAIQGRRASGTGDILIDLTGGSLSRTGATGGVVLGRHVGTGSLTINMSGGATLEATGAGVRGLTGTHVGNGDLTIGLSGGSIATPSTGIGATRGNSATTGNIAVTVSHANSVVRTTGNNGHGLTASNSGAGDVTLTMRDGLIETSGGGSRGISAYSSYTGMNPGTVSVVMEGGAVRTSGGTYVTVLHAHGIYAESNNGRGDVSARMTGGAVETAGASANGLYVLKRGPAGAGSIEMTGGSVTTAGDSANGAYVHMYDTGASTEGLSIDAASAVSVEGLNARGLLGVHTGLGSATVTTGTAAEIAAPFAVGMEGRLTNDASATGRIVVTHGGAAEAREVGVLAWAARSSGHTMGAGATTANDAARTAPMIHVTSSGDVTVGASVSDAFIRARIAGADETLSAAEQAVLSAIMSDASDASDALTTALAALSDDDYDADWKAEAQDLLRKRAASSAAPTGDGPAAHRAAEEILGLSRAGVRASALSHTAIADHVRAGDALSDAERAVLDAVLTKGAGSELETALTTLTGAAYTTAWKNTVRRLAATYNAGDIQVDVTGGSIAAEGNGVEALYAVPHDSNGAITVTVAEGARVTGGANGLLVRGGGAGEGSLRAQSVTVNGAVTGGTGAGVRMIDGGRLTVGKTGRIGATSGVGVLSDGAGDLHATVAGTVKGDIRMAGTGALTLAVPEGGAVTGTVRDPVGLSTVVGSIGRLHYTSGVTVTVAATGRLTGVEVDGRTEALRSESGDLSLTVADGGMVEGDVQARGGTLKLSVTAGSAVTGTVRDPASPLTVVGSIGRLLYTNGGTVTVAATGRLTGVEVDGRTEALHSESGDLSLTVADKGMVTGDVLGLGDGDHTVTVAHGGTVKGTIHLAASTVRVAGTVGRVRFDNGGQVTVGGTGRLTSIEDQAIANVRGDLEVEIRQAPDEHPKDMTARVPGRITSNGGRKVTIVTADGEEWRVGPRGTSDAAPMGAYDVGLERDRLVPDYAPRSRVYEALPSVLLGLNGTSGFHDRMAAPRSPNGVWARIEASGGSHETERSTSTLGAGLSWAERRYGAETGVDFPLETGVAGLSAHHRRASAEVSGNDGRIDVAGEGLGASMAWRLSDDMYVAGEVSATRYDVAMKSGRRGSLRSGVRGFGHAVGVEVGRRVDLGPGPLGALTATPRVRLSYSRVDMDDFTDAVDARVSLDKGRATTGVAGVALEASEGRGRMFGSVDVEHGFSRETVMRVSEVALSSQSEATRARFEVGGSVEWSGGRYALQGAARWATGARDYGGGMVFKVRF